MAVVEELASCRYLGWARFVRSSATLRSSPRVKVVVLRMMRVTMRLVPFSPRLDVFVDSIDEPGRVREKAMRDERSRNEEPLTRATNSRSTGKDSPNDNAQTDLGQTTLSSTHVQTINCL